MYAYFRKRQHHYPKWIIGKLGSRAEMEAELDEQLKRRNEDRRARLRETEAKRGNTKVKKVF